jgi:NhaP-type Na+/H+ or K+/H+ antiporter
LLGAPKSKRAKPFVAWFGIRGIGSLYYLFYATQHGLSPELAQQFVALTFSVVALSIVAHGLSVTPLMSRYNRQKP